MVAELHRQDLAVDRRAVHLARRHHTDGTLVIPGSDNFPEIAPVADLGQGDPIAGPGARLVVRPASAEGPQGSRSARPWRRPRPSSTAAALEIVRHRER